MLERYRSLRITVLVLASTFALIALVWLGLTISNQWIAVHEANAAYQENAEKDRQKSADIIAQSCRNSSFFEVRKCVRYHIETYYKEQATNKDLQAQQDMAFWGFWLLIISGLGVLVSGLGVCLLIATLRQGKRGILQAEGAVEEARIANNIAQSSVELSEKMMIQTERARITSLGTESAANFDQKTGMFMGLHIRHKWQNIGRTEGVNCKMIWMNKILKSGQSVGDLGLGFNNKEELSSHTFKWPPQNIQNVPIRIQDQISLEQIVQIFETDARMICWAGVYYDDIFESGSKEIYLHHDWVCLEFRVISDPKLLEPHERIEFELPWFDEFELPENQKPRRD